MNNGKLEQYTRSNNGETGDSIVANYIFKCEKNNNSNNHRIYIAPFAMRFRGAMENLNKTNAQNVMVVRRIILVADDF